MKKINHQKHSIQLLMQSFVACLMFLINFSNDVNASGRLKINQADFIITGNVKDEMGKNLAGVSVTVKHTETGTITNADGNFSFSVPDQNAVLVFSFSGMQTLEVMVGNRQVINVVLAVANKEMDEVVVIGYGKVRKSDLTGSVSSVKGDDLTLGVAYSPETALRGKAAGVQVTQSSGEPGQGAIVRVRGTNSINSDNSPLWVIDGIPVSDGNMLNAADIQSIEILKDASATAIYGARGANGVILVTTKSGQAGIPKISLDMYYGVQSLAKKIQLTNSTEYGILMNEYAAGVGGNPMYNVDTLGTGTDWQDEVYRNAPVQNYQVAVSGGNARTKYYISTNYIDMAGIIRNASYNRFSLRTNVTTDVTDKLRVGVNANLFKTVSDKTNTSFNTTDNFEVITLALTAMPTLPIYDNDGNYILYTDVEQRRGNPVALANENIDMTTINRMMGNVFGEYEFFKGLSFRTSFGFDINNVKRNIFQPNTVAQGSGANGIGSVRSAMNQYWVSNNILTYQTAIDKHSINATLGYTIEENTSENVLASSSDFISQEGTYNNLAGSNPDNYGVGSGASRSAIMSFLGRINYIFNNKYLVTITGRYDGASVFAVNRKWGFFPSAAFAWRISEEPFMKEFGKISNLKLRASVGKSGAQAINPYQSLASFTNAYYSLGTGRSVMVLGQSPNRLANNNLGWESTAQTDIGLDVGLFGGRLNFTADYYYKKTSDLLYEISIPNTTGFTTALQNSAKVENRGLELAIDANVLRGDLKWDVRFNIAFNKNKVLSLDGIRTIDFPRGGIVYANLTSNASVLKVGEPIGIFYGYLSQGIDSAGGLLIKNFDEEPKITANDRTIMGNPNPVHVGGITNIFKYKNFDLTVFCNWVAGNDIYWLGEIYNQWLNLGYNASKRYYDNRWTPIHTNATYPRVNYDPRVYADNSSHIYDGSYFRIKNITLGYTVPFKNTRRSLRIYANADNLITVTKYPGYNPEISAFGGIAIAQGVDLGVYPNAKTFMVGLNYSF